MEGDLYDIRGAKKDSRRDIRKVDEKYKEQARRLLRKKKSR